MYTYAFIVTDTPINLLDVDLPPYIGVANTHPMSGGRCTVLYTGGALIENGVSAVRAAYLGARATTNRDEAATWLKETA